MYLIDNCIIMFFSYSIKKILMLLRAQQSDKISASHSLGIITRRCYCNGIIKLLYYMANEQILF